MIRISPDQRCTCSRPVYVRTYPQRPACLCGRFIVRSDYELSLLRHEEARELERELDAELGRPSSRNGAAA